MNGLRWEELLNRCYTSFMEIAVLGWGSLVWCPGILGIKTKWRSDGPALPIEFARISRDGRLTLVIVPDSDDQPTYWAFSEFHTLEEARDNLREREGTSKLNIHYLDAAGRIAPGIPGPVRDRVREWLGVRREVEAVVWTGLPTNWLEQRGHHFTTEDAVRYLKQLELQRDRSLAVHDRAREYVRNAPKLIQTVVRRAMQREGWQDNRLSTLLFED